MADHGCVADTPYKPPLHVCVCVCVLQAAANLGGPTPTGPARTAGTHSWLDNIANSARAPRGLQSDDAGAIGVDAEPASTRRGAHGRGRRGRYSKLLVDVRATLAQRAHVPVPRRVQWWWLRVTCQLPPLALVGRGAVSQHQRGVRRSQALLAHFGRAEHSGVRMHAGTLCADEEGLAVALCRAVGTPSDSLVHEAPGACGRDSEVRPPAVFLTPQLPCPLRVRRE